MKFKSQYEISGIDFSKQFAEKAIESLKNQLISKKMITQWLTEQT
jgi:hypothetical protein